MQNLPIELFNQIILYLDIKSIHNIALCNKECYNMLDDSYIWYKLTCRDFIVLKYKSSKNYKILYTQIGSGHIPEIITDMDHWKFICHKNGYTKNNDSSLIKCTSLEQLRILFKILHKEFFSCYQHKPDGIERTFVIFDDDDNPHNIKYDTYQQFENFGKISLDEYCKCPRQNPYILSSENIDNIKFVMRYILKPDKYCRKLLHDNIDIILKQHPDKLQFLLSNVSNPHDQCVYIMTNRKLLNNHLIDIEHIKILFRYINNPLEICSTRIGLCENVFSFINDITIFKYIVDICGGAATVFSHTRNRILLSNYSSYEIRKYILQTIPNHNEYCYLLNPHGQTALFYLDDVKEAKLLLDNVDDINKYCRVQDEKGHTALYYHTGNDAVISLLSQYR